MSEQSLREQLVSIVEPIVTGMGLELWGLEYSSSGKRRLVRIYIDTKGDGVHVDQCAEVSRHVGVVLDVEDIIPGAYVLEVSSPGLERPFFSLEQLRDYLGQEVNLRLKLARDGRRNWKGTLTSIGDSSFCLQTGKDEVCLEWDEVQKANLVVKDYFA